MADKVRFGLEIEFEGSVTERDEITRIGRKVLIALTKALYAEGLAPDGSKLITKAIRVGDKDLKLECDCLKDTVNGN